MKMVRDSLYDLWKELFRAVLKEDIPGYIGQTALNDRQLDYIARKVWHFMEIGSNPDTLPNIAGRAFTIAWGSCQITHRQVAKRLTTQMKEEGHKIKGSLSENDVKGYLSSVRNTIRERVRRQSKEWDWIRNLKRLK